MSLCFNFFKPANLMLIVRFLSYLDSNGLSISHLLYACLKTPACLILTELLIRTLILKQVATHGSNKNQHLLKDLLHAGPWDGWMDAWGQHHGGLTQKPCLLILGRKHLLPSQVWFPYRDSSQLDINVTAGDVLLPSLFLDIPLSSPFS